MAKLPKPQSQIIKVAVGSDNFLLYSDITARPLIRTLDIPPSGPAPTFTSLQAYSVFCTLRYLFVNDPNDNLTLTEEDMINKTGISADFVQDIITLLISNGLCQYTDSTNTNISLTKKGEDIRNINSFSRYFP